jgi:hypothetical protein
MKEMPMLFADIAPVSMAQQVITGDDMMKHEPHRCAFRKVVEAGNAKAKEIFEAEEHKLKTDIEKSHAFLTRKNRLCT